MVTLTTTHLRNPSVGTDPTSRDNGIEVKVAVVPVHPLVITHHYRGSPRLVHHLSQTLPDILRLVFGQRNHVRKNRRHIQLSIRRDAIVLRNIILMALRRRQCHRFVSWIIIQKPNAEIKDALISLRPWALCHLSIFTGPRRIFIRHQHRDKVIEIILIHESLLLTKSLH